MVLGGRWVCNLLSTNGQHQDLQDYRVVKGQDAAGILDATCYGVLTDFSRWIHGGFTEVFLAP